MKQILSFFQVLSLFVLVSCNSGGDSSPLSKPGNSGDPGNSSDPGDPASDLSGTVSSVLNFINPISSAYAADEICTTPDGTNKGVEIYLVDISGNELLICYANLNTNGSFNSRIYKNRIPRDSEIIIKATWAGGHRKAFVNTKSSTPISVDALATISSSIIQDQWAKGNDYDVEGIRKSVREFIRNSLGEEVSEMKAHQVARINQVFRNSKEAVEQTLFKHGADSVMDELFKNFLANAHKNSTIEGRGGYIADRALVYNEENAKALEVENVKGVSESESVIEIIETAKKAAKK